LITKKTEDNIQKTKKKINKAKKIKLGKKLKIVKKAAKITNSQKAF
jgi:hypothetical protein